MKIDAKIKIISSLSNSINTPITINKIPNLSNIFDFGWLNL